MKAPKSEATAKHTPGPWTVDGKYIRTQAIAFEGATCGVTVAKAEKSAVGSEQARANAALIAAAPDLKAALLNLMVAYSTLLGMGASPSMPAFLDATAAIARAEGRQ